MDLAGDINLEEGETRGTVDSDLHNDNIDGWVNEVALLTEEEAAKLSESVLLVRLVLVEI